MVTNDEIVKIKFFKVILLTNDITYLKNVIVFIIFSTITIAFCMIVNIIIIIVFVIRNVFMIINDQIVKIRILKVTLLKLSLLIMPLFLLFSYSLFYYFLPLFCWIINIRIIIVITIMNVLWLLLLLTGFLFAEIGKYFKEKVFFDFVSLLLVFIAIKGEC